MSTFFSLVTELETLLSQLNIILAGSDSETVNVNGVNKDSVSKAIKDRFSEIKALAEQRESFKTKALLDAYNAPEDTLAEVWNDSDNTKNGLYGRSGSNWVKSAYSYKNIVDSANTNIPVTGQAVAYSRDFVNVTAEFPIENGFHTFDTAVRTIVQARKRKGMVLSYETSASVWETVEFRGSDLVSDWVQSSKWISHAYRLIGVPRNSVLSQYFKKGMVLNYINDGGERIVEQYIGENNPSTTTFRDDVNWVQLATLSDLQSSKDELKNLAGVWINVTATYPLESGYHDFDSAVREIPTENKKHGLIITYEVSDGEWETVEFRGDNLATEWVQSSKWVNHNYSLIGVSRDSVPSQYFKKGMVLNYINGDGERIVEQYVGTSQPSTTEFRDDDNWIQLEVKSWRSENSPTTISANKDKVQSLQVSLFEDASRLEFVNGTFTSTTGEIINLTNTKRVITPRPLTVTDLESIVVENGHFFILTELDENKNYLANTSWVSSKSTFNKNTRYIMLMIKNSDESDIAPSDITKESLVITSRLKPSWRELYDRDRISTDALSDAFVVSDWQVQKMAHVSTVTEDNYSESGFLWSGYYASEETYSENILSDVDCKLLKMNPCDFSKPVEFNALSKGDVVGSFEQSTNTAPYDPTLIVRENDIMYLMVAENINDSEGVRYINRTFDKGTDTFSNTIDNLNIRYTHNSTEYTEVLSVDNVNTMFERLFGRTGVSVGLYPIFSGRIIEREGFYWIYLGGLSSDPNGIQGCILKSVDGITWDYVSAPPLAWYGVWEGAVEVIGDYVYCFLKADNRYRLYRYNHVSDVWDVESEISNQKLARPFLWYYNGKLYAIYNGPDNVTTWGAVNRSTVVISVIDQDTLEILDQQVVKTDAGSHYMSATSFKGTPYFMFTEDRRKHDINQMKGNVSIIKMDFLKV